MMSATPGVASCCMSRETLLGIAATRLSLASTTTTLTRDNSSISVSESDDSFIAGNGGFKYQISVPMREYFEICFTNEPMHEEWWVTGKIMGVCGDVKHDISQWE